MLEALNLVREYADICSFRKCTFQYQYPLNFADFRIFCKKTLFWGETVPLLKAILQELC